MTPIVRRTAVAIAAVALVPALGGCWTGLQAATTLQGPSGDGGHATIGSVDVRQAVLVATNPVTGTETISAAVINNGNSDDVLQSIVVGNGSASTSLPTAGLSLAAGGAIAFGWNGGPSVGVYGLKAPISSFVQLTFVFRDAGTTSVQALVVPATGYYSAVTPAPPTKP